MRTKKILRIVHPAYSTWPGMRVSFPLSLSHHFSHPPSHRIEAQQAVDIKLYSATYAEEEMLLLPGTELKVRGAVQLADDVWEVQLEEIVSPFPMVS